MNVYARLLEASSFFYHDPVQLTTSGFLFGMVPRKHVTVAISGYSFAMRQKFNVEQAFSPSIYTSTQLGSFNVYS